MAHEPPVCELLPDADHIRAAVDQVEDAYRAYGPGAGWERFIALVMHQGPLTEAVPAPAQWPPAGGGGDESPSQERSAKALADDETFFLRMLKPFTRYQPPVDALRSSGPRIVVAVGENSGDEIAGRSSVALAELLGADPVRFPGDHGGFMADPAGFAAAIRRVSAASR
jgi:hypothetical protein